MNQLEVQIMGQGYLLACPEGGEERLREAASRVDAAMCKIRDAGKVKARDRIAVLTALNLAFDLVDSDPAPVPVVPPLPVQDQQALGTSVEAQLAALIGRLDAALGDDGRLI